MGELAFRLLLAMKMTRHILYLLVVLSKVVNLTSAKEECTITPLNPINALTATGGALASGTENVMIQCSCTIINDDLVRWYDPTGVQLYNNASREFIPGTPHYTRVESPTDNMNIILVIPALNDTYDGTYYCGIKVNRTTFRAPNASVVLTIYGIAKINPPNNAIVREGNTTTITCEALGYPPPTVVWNRIDGNLSDRVSVSDSVSVPTGNGNVTRVSVNLTITNTYREDTGVYTCSANNSMGSDNRNVSIIVQFQAEIINDVTDLLENETNPVTFTCQSLGEPVPTISWYFNDDMINVSDTSKYNIASSVNGTLVESLLTIVSVISSDVGTYTCHANNFIGMDINSRILTVNVRATIHPLNNTIVREGDTTTITCEALGYPPPTIVWNRIDESLSDRVSVRDSVSVPAGNGNVTRVSVNLTITNAYREDTGVYTCSANNTVGSDNRNVSITVQFQAEINNDVADLLENETNPVTFTCQSLGEPVPTISWYFNDDMINVSDASKYNITSSVNGTLVESLLTIVSVISSDVGTYTCHANNFIGTDINSGILTVYVRATIYSLNNTVVIEDNTSTITCEAIGYPPPTIVWNRIDGNLSDRVSVGDSVSVPTGNGNVTRVSVNLTITNAYREDTGVYTCSANNIVGNDSKNVSITVQFWATIHLLNNTVVREGNTTTITCEALGYPPPTIVWNRIDGNLSDRVSVNDSVSVPTGYGNVTRVSVNLTITNAYRKDTGVYICSANNIVGSDNRNVSITVQFQAEIINDVADLLENETNPVTFTCQSLGEPVPTISWYFNDDMINVSDASKYNITSSVNGTLVESLLTIVSLISSDVGTYTCHANNIIGTDINSGILTVNVRATISSLNNTVVIEGYTSTITCEAIGYPPPTIVWNRTDGNLSDRVSVSDSVNVPTGNGNVTRVIVNLTITNAYREDTGVYTCSANNIVGNDSKNVSITVQFIPTINRNITDKTINETESVDFTCEATSEPVPDFIWYFDDAIINILDSKYSNVSRSLNITTTENTLTVYNVASSDVGTYTCTATNVVGNDSNSGHLQVNVSPEIESFDAMKYCVPAAEPMEYCVPENYDITINCSAIGYPQPSLQWTRNGMKFNNERFTVNNIPCSSNCLVDARVTSSLMITNASRSDIDMYTCTATNILGKVNASLQLIVQYHVNILQNKSGYDVINNSIVNAFNNPERSIVLDCATVRGHENALWMVQRSSKNFDQSHYTVTNHSVYLSTITVTDPGMNISVSLKCMSDTSKEYRIVTVTTENPYLRVLSEMSVATSTGTRPIFMYVIAVDADGTREGQKNLSSIASFEFVNSDGEAFNYSSNFTEFEETSFQYYNFALPVLEENAGGNYTLTLQNSEGNYTSEAVNITVEKIEGVTVNTTNSGITILQGDNVTLSCRPSQSDIALQWSYNGSDISSSPQYQFTPYPLNHDLTITHANDTDSGNYTCAFELQSGTVDQQSIILTVLSTCLQDFAGGLLWPTSRRNRTVTQRCSFLYPSFRSSATISRQCFHNDTWGPVDDSRCTALSSAIPTLIISFEVNVSQADAQRVVNNITHQIISSSDVTFVSNDSVLYDLQQTGSTGVLIRLTSNELIENSTLPRLSSFDIPNNILLDNDDTKLYIPGLKCRCQLTNESIRTICIGPSIPPCNCSSQQSCECNQPFVGNGDVCGLDTDGDGCPDVDLGCPYQSCSKDLCINDYTMFPHCNDDDSICNRVNGTDTSMCSQEIGVDWNILWHSATRGETILQKCPEGAESLGLASRSCSGDPAVWDAPNVEECSTVEITRIAEEVNNLMDIYAACYQNTDNLDCTIMIEPEMFQFTIDQLASITGNIDRAILPNDLRHIIIATKIILRIIRSDAVTLTEDKLQNLLEIFNNIYNLRNQVAYNILDTKKMEDERSIGSVALDNVEILAGVVKNALKVNDSVSHFREFISIEAQLLMQSDIDKGINFPKNKINFSVQSEISNSIIRQYPGPVAHAFLANSFLPSDFDGPGEYDHSFPVLAVQISATERVELPENSSVLLKFNIPEDLEKKENSMKCVFWQPDRNSWSDEGVLTNKVNNTVECRTTHLTSFSVLVDTQGNTDSTTAETTLSIITYIGCGISILSLLLTMLVILYWRKSLYKGVPNFIHFNLALSLFIGLIVFVSGIETAKDNEAGCTAVAVMLHYFFLAAFSWMLCEGLYLFIFINLVFYNGFLIKWYFYLGLGWGLPVPIVAIAAGIGNDHYGSELGCWLSESKGTIWAFVAPMLLIILVNSIFLAISLRVAYRSKRRDVSTKLSRVDAVKSICISAFSLMPILGSTWIIGIFTVNEHTEFFAWIFTILNSLQGFLIFFFYVLKQEKVRKKVKTSNFVQRFSETFLTSLSRQSKTLSANNESFKTGVNLDTSRYRSTRNESIALTSVTFDVVKSVKSPTEGTTFTIEPSSVLEKNCFLDSYAANGEPENKSSHTDANGTEILNTTTVICNKDDNTDNSSTD